MRKFTKYPITASKYSDSDWKHVTDMHITNTNPLTVEATLDGADYVNIWYDDTTNKYYIEDPFDGVVSSADTAYDIFIDFTQNYIVDDDDVDKLRKAAWQPPQWMMDLEEEYQTVKQNFNPDDYHYACYYTAGNPTWGFDARKYVYEAGGVPIYGFRKDNRGKFSNRAPLYLFPSLNEYDAAKNAIRESGIIVDMQDPFEINVADDLKIHEIESPTGL